MRGSFWLWGTSRARLGFDDGGVSGALETPWGEGRWGSMPGSPAVLWATFAWHTHLLTVHGGSMSSYRCEDGETRRAQLETARSSLSALGQKASSLVGQCSSEVVAPRLCERALLDSPWRLSRGWRLRLAGPSTSGCSSGSKPDSSKPDSSRGGGGCACVQQVGLDASDSLASECCGSWSCTGGGANGSAGPSGGLMHVHVRLPASCAPAYVDACAIVSKHEVLLVTAPCAGCINVSVGTSLAPTLGRSIVRPIRKDANDDSYSYDEGQSELNPA